MGQSSREDEKLISKLRNSTPVDADTDGHSVPFLGMAKADNGREKSSADNIDNDETKETTNRRQKVLRRNVLKGAVSAGALSLFPRTVQGNSHEEIDSCTAITRSGTYKLTQDIQGGGNCIRIRQSNVTFDGQGHTIRAANPQVRHGNGIDIRSPLGGGDLSNVTVRNVNVTGFFNGVAVESTRASTIQGVTATENDKGLFVNGNEMLLSSNTVTFNDDTGIVTRGNRSSIRGNTVHRNVLRGIYVRNDSFGTRVLGNTVTSHQSEYGEAGSPGIVIKGERGSHIVATNELGGNLIHILLENTGNNTIRRNSSIESPDTVDTAIRLEDFAHGNTIENNSFEKGIQISESDNTAVRGNTVSQVDILDGENNTVFDNEVRRIGATGSPQTSIVGNTVTGATTFSTGVTVTRSATTTIQGNEISAARNGILIRGSPRSKIRFNQIGENTIGVHILGELVRQLTITGNNLVDNSQFGILNTVPAYLSARHNYWGAPNGPSSPDDPDAPLADALTGKLADGDGDAVSEWPGRPGISNVGFAGWSRNPNPIITREPPEIGPGNPPINR